MCRSGIRALFRATFESQMAAELAVFFDGSVSQLMKPSTTSFNIWKTKSHSPSSVDDATGSADGCRGGVSVALNPASLQV